MVCLRSHIVFQKLGQGEQTRYFTAPEPFTQSELVVISVARCLSSTIASKDISSCIIGWILTKLDKDDPYMAFINLIV